ncbi:MAG TPA: LysM peptidoglycan-binding domain-containing protein [Anaerolineaceae bacterium]
MKKALAVACLFLASLFWLSAALPAFAQPSGQGLVINTPTPLPDGRILYKVKANDTCLSISLVMGISLDKLRSLNNLSTDCVIREGQELLLGKVEPTATPLVTGPTATATALLPTPTQFKGTANVCFLLFNDANGDAIREETEAAIPDGAINITDRLGKYSRTLKTSAGTDPVCLQDVPEGDYNVSVAVPDGYNATTSMNYALKVQAGDSTTLDFGAQLNSQSAPAAGGVSGSRSPILGILGGLLLFGGVGLGIYLRRAPRA